MNSAIQQDVDATGGDAVANIAQAGTIDIGAQATATGKSGTAYAYNQSAIDQDANSAGGDATVTLTLWRAETSLPMDGKRNGFDERQRLCLCERL